MLSVRLRGRAERLSYVYTMLIIVLPIMGVYAVPFLPLAISLGELLLIGMIPFIILAQVGKSVTVNFSNPFWEYLIYSLMATLIASCSLFFMFQGYDVTDMLFRVVRDMFYFLLILFFGKDFFDFSLGIKILLKVAKFASLFMLVQFLAYQIFRLSVWGILPGVQTTISGGVVSNEVIEHFMKSAIIDGYLRAYGFFSEPAAAAQYLSVALIAIFFLNKKHKIDFKWAILISLAILVTFSVNGYIALIFSWGMMFIKAKKSKRAKKICLIIGVLLVLSIPIVLSNEKINGVFIRLISLFKGESTQNSAAVRVLRGPVFFLNMPFVYQVFGSGFGNFESFKAIFAIDTVYEQATEYLNTNSYVAISSGLIGLLLYIRGIWSNTVGKPYFAKVMALLVFLLGFACSIYSSPIYVIYLLLIINCPKRGKQNDKHNHIARHM